MALTSTSTRAEALAQYNDNLSWEGSATKATLELEAVRWLLANRPARIAESNRSLDYETLSRLEEKLSNYISLFGGSVNKASFTQGRMLV